MSSYDVPSLGIQEGMYASANFPDADDTRPLGAHMEALGGNQDAIQGIVQQTIGRHITESLPPRTSPQMNSVSSNWRKRLREMMIHQNETVLGFLYKPLTEHPTLGPVEQALRRYALRQDIDTGAVKTFKGLLDDMSGNHFTQIQAEIEDAVSKKGTSNLLQVRGQVGALIDLYKETGEKLLECENHLKMRLDKMDKIQRRVSIVIEMQTNEATADLVQALEAYLKVSFRDMGIEANYKALIYLYQKHIALREAMQVFKTGSQVASEPLCPICITETVGMAINPCGHTFCQTCAKRMVNECGVCRGRIRDRLKLFFS
jgi:hypothetical protein